MTEEDKTTAAPAAQETVPDTQPAAAPTEEKLERKASIAPNTTQVTARAKRRREEAVRRLVSDVQARPETRSSQAESQDWIIASTVAAALERGLDRDLHQELVQEAKENSGRIGQVCHDHSDVFLASVGKVVALGGPSADLANKLLGAQEELELKTAGPMITSAHLWETAKDSHSRATALYIMVNACQKVAMWLERARKQAALGRPRAALEAVDEARTALTAPMSSLFYGTSMEHAASYLKKATQKKELLMNTKTNTSNPSNPQSDKDATNAAKNTTLASLEETPFGRRAILMLPKIENEVLMGARRGLNRWFLALRSGGDGAKAGRAVLRKCAYSMAVGPGQLGLGGHVPPSYLWRSKVSDNLISRMNQNGRVVRAVRLGFWFERDGPKEAARLEHNTAPGMERRAEAFASAFGWYRCWDEHVSLMVDPSDYTASDMGRAGAAAAGLSGSRHGLGGSRHGAGSARGGRTLGFRASRTSQTNMNIGLNATTLMGTNSTNKESEKSKWAALLTPAILFDNTPTR
jgi:hypothetical protein